MIKTILVPATGRDTDIAVFGSALAIARPFGAHLDFLHVRIDAATTAATIASDVSSPQVVTDLINKMEEEAEQREQKARQLFESLCRREGLALAETPPGPSAPSARRLKEIGSEPYWLVEYARAADLLIIGRPGDDQIAPSDVLEAALLNSGRPLLYPRRRQWLLYPIPSSSPGKRRPKPPARLPRQCRSCRSQSRSSS